MGTRFELVLADASPERHRAAGEAALEEIESCHRRLTRFEPSGLPAHLARCRAGGPVPLDADTFALLADALAVWRVSGGAFDLTVPRCRMDAIVLDPVSRTVRLAVRDVVLDFGGIAKGHALDLAAAVLRRAGVTAAFLHGGTSSAVGIGPPLVSAGEPALGWRVALGRGAGAPTVTLRDEALSISAVWKGNPHPTMDPRTGRPLAGGEGGARRVAVVGPSARLADAWSTALLVTGKRPAALGPDWRTWIES
ncbi:MAG TPA: FAD:protein FMN transferase [Gemmatimonadales bacterium]|jgi:thiamine biosynthesis lipoprotein|nr:FAD:protein FMN transferase [Gemmatimonadales bacterium]